DGYWVYVGTPANPTAYHSGPLSGRSVTLSNLPADGTVVRLWLYSLIDGQYGHVRNRDFLSIGDIPPANSTLEQAVARIRAERDHLRANLGPANHAFPDAFLASVAAMAYTVGRVSAPLFGYRSAVGLPLPTGGTRLAVAE